jgi:hypothetical protein
MRVQKLSTITFMASVMLLTACGEDFSGGSRVFTPQQEEQPTIPSPVEFRTRLNNSLLIAGVRCKGDETTEPGGHGSQCVAGNYLVFIDDVNICNSGICTDFVVTPIVGSLEDINTRDPISKVFFIIPESEVSGAQKTILDNVALEVDINGNGAVFFR